MSRSGLGCGRRRIFNRFKLNRLKVSGLTEGDIANKAALMPPLAILISNLTKLSEPSRSPAFPMKPKRRRERPK
jgi:hypothetical protein